MSRKLVFSEHENLTAPCLIFFQIMDIIISNHNLVNHDLIYGGDSVFIGRETELKFLNDKYEEKGGQLIVLYGRRRVGKTETLREFCKGKPHVFFPYSRHETFTSCLHCT